MMCSLFFTSGEDNLNIQNIWCINKSTQVGVSILAYTISDYHKF